MHGQNHINLEILISLFSYLSMFRLKPASFTVFITKNHPKLASAISLSRSSDRWKPPASLLYVHISKIFQENIRLVSNRMFLRAIVRISV